MKRRKKHWATIWREYLYKLVKNEAKDHRLLFHRYLETLTMKQIESLYYAYRLGDM